mmetsp:Transcript_107035/g.228556  ORF Transcript_107035/g.228556 Transcript_107035/m.228556 type:complete len:214 (-) Transcript_107035:12-653(-)
MCLAANARSLNNFSQASKSDSMSCLCALRNVAAFMALCTSITDSIALTLSLAASWISERACLRREETALRSKANAVRSLSGLLRIVSIFSLIWPVEFVVWAVTRLILSLYSRSKLLLMCSNTSRNLLIPVASRRIFIFATVSAPSAFRFLVSASLLAPVGITFSAFSARILAIDMSRCLNLGRGLLLSSTVAEISPLGHSIALCQRSRGTCFA